MEYDGDTLAYFKALIEGRADISWHPWWNANCDWLWSSLTHPEFLRLKFANGDGVVGNAVIAKVVDRVRRIKDEVEHSQELDDLQFDAESLCDEGVHVVAIPLLQVIARWKTGSDRQFPAIEVAQQN